MSQQRSAKIVVDLDSGDVQRGEVHERLPPKPLMLLRYFILRENEVVTRDELMESVWGHLEAASEDAVNVAISSLRRALDDQRRPHRVIQTIPRRGYRYIGEGIVLASAAAADGADLSADSNTRAESATAPPSAGEATARSKAGLTAPLIGLAALALIALLVWGLPGSREPASVSTNSSQSAASAAPSVAVLPFLDLSPDADQGYFADALVDRIIHILAQADGLQVAARTSSFAFRESPAQVEEIGLKLRVSAVLEGSVLHDGEKMRVLAQLIDVESGKHLWSRAYDRPAGELFQLQDEIANDVSQTMTNTLLGDEVLEPPANREAYELTVQARRAVDQGTLDSVEQGIELFQRALAIDPEHVPALVGWFEAGGLRHGLAGGSTKEQMQGAFGALERAVSLAPNNPDVLRAKAQEQRRLGRNDEAIATFKRGLELNPNDSDALGKLGDLYLHLGRYDEGLQALRLAERIDPFSERIATRLADAYWSVGRAEEALAKLRDNIRNSPQVPANYSRMATYLNQMGRTGEAMRYIIAQRELDPDSPIRQFRVCEFYLQLADDAAAESCTDEFEQNGGPRFRVVYLRQIIHNFRGEWAQQNALMDELLILANPNDPLTPALVAWSHARQECPRALTVLRDYYPTVFHDQPEMSPVQLLAARVGIYCLQRSDQSEQAQRLLQAYEETIERIRLQQGPWIIAGDERAAGYALAGEDNLAVQELTRLVDSDWRYYWWQLHNRVEYQHLATRADFIAMQQKLRAGVAKELEYFRQHRNQPLL